MLTLVEKAEAAIKEEDAEEMTKRLLSAKFDFNDFLKQSKMMSSMGSMGSIMKMLPGQSARPLTRAGPCTLLRCEQWLLLHSLSGNHPCMLCGWDD